MRRYCLMNLVALSLLTSTGFAQEKIPTPAQLKEKGIALLKTGEVKEPQAVETANLVVVVGLPEAKAKTLAESLEKTYAFAAKGLKLDQREDDKEAKLSVYVFPNLDAYHAYVRSALKRRPEKDETFTMDTKAVTPFIAVTPKRGETTANYETLVSEQICGGAVAAQSWQRRLD